MHERVALPDDLEESDEQSGEDEVNTEANEEDIHNRETHRWGMERAPPLSARGHSRARG